MKTLTTPLKSLEHKLKTRLTPIRKLIVHLQTEKYCTLKVPFSKRLKAWKLGFTSKSYALFSLDQNNPEDYFRDFSDINYVMNTPGANAVNDKFTFARMMSSKGIPSPAILALINRGAVVYPLYHSKTTGKDLTGFLETLLATYEKLVFRPAFFGAGIGVFFLEYHDNRLIMNDEPATITEICEFIQKQHHYLITEFVDQAEYARAIYPDVANTVRILTIWDSTKNRPVITNAAHRIGTSRSFPIDNFHGGLGGLCCPIDLFSGELGQGISLSSNGHILHHDTHPETGGQITGITIPHWKTLKEMVVKSAEHFAASPYIGWDIIVTDNGPSIIEGNSPPGTTVWQVCSPLLQDSRLKRFYREQGMLV